MHRNRILTEIYGALSYLENQKIQNATKKLKKTSDCNYKMYETVKNINRLNFKKGTRVISSITKTLVNL